MNVFDQEMVGLSGLGELDGFFSKIKKAVKKVHRKAKKITTGIHKKVTPKFVQKFENKYGLNPHKLNPKRAWKGFRAFNRKVLPKPVVKAIEKKEKIGKKVVRNKAFQAVVSVVASVYGFGAVAGAAFAALDIYDQKVAAKKVSQGDVKAFYRSLEFMIKMSDEDTDKILNTLSPKVATQARQWLALQRKARGTRQDKTKTGVLKEVEKVGMEIGKEKPVVAAVNKLQNQGKTTEQIIAEFMKSDFFKNTAKPIATAAIQPDLYSMYQARGMPDAQYLSYQDTKKLVNENPPETGSKFIVPALIGAALLMPGVV